MHISLKQPGVEIKTLRSQFSSIDMFSKLEASFLQKFFKYNLADYFDQMLTNMYEGIFDKKLQRGIKNTQQPSISKLEKYISFSLFVAENKFTVQQFQKNIQNFYRDRSISVSKNQLPYAFKLRYSSLKSVPSLIKPGQLIFVDVKIKADVQKIQELPQKIINFFEHYRLAKKGQTTKVQQYLANYRGQYLNIFIVYFGDCNFQIFNKKAYQTNTIKLMGNFYKLRIFCFYVSKQALVETFKSINKIENLEYINDLVIQFYELKRQKQRRKRNKKLNNSVRIPRNQTENDSYREKLYMFIGVFGLVGFGFAIKKLLL